MDSTTGCTSYNSGDTYGFLDPYCSLNGISAGVDGCLSVDCRTCTLASGLCPSIVCTDNAVSGCADDVDVGTFMKHCPRPQSASRKFSSLDSMQMPPGLQDWKNVALSLTTICIGRPAYQSTRRDVPI